MFGAIVLVLIPAMALLAPVLAPHDPYDQQLARRLINPIWHADGTWTHPLGTDGMGRDYLSRLMYGARISLLIGIAAMFISGIIGSTLGIAAGYFGGKVDMVISFIITVRLAMPVVLVALAVVALIGGARPRSRSAQLTT
jgi:peptide/nickel transport system permease protein